MHASPPAMAFSLPRRRNLFRLFFLAGVFIFFRLTFSSSHPSHSFSTSRSHQIEEHNFLERNTRPDKSLNKQKIGLHQLYRTGYTTIGIVTKYLSESESQHTIGVLEN
ncbi:hypothetical protein PM082_021478 [Marasmius tenuissimus]|nr:hypothetical protein PM082_021478 [Marasmius tenuissimus]